MSEQAEQEHPTAKWEDSLDGLDEGRKQELARRLWGWTPEMASADHPGPFADERLNGLEVFWLAVCALAGRDGDLAKTAQDLRNRHALPLPALHLERANLSGAQ